MMTDIKIGGKKDETDLTGLLPSQKPASVPLCPQQGPGW